MPAADDVTRPRNDGPRSGAVEGGGPQRIALLAPGSRGDAEPVVALGVELAARGHAVKVIGSSDHAAACAAWRLPFVDLGYSVRALLRSAAGRGLLTAGSAWGSRARLVEVASSLIPAAGPALVAACADADVILSNETLFLVASSIAEARPGTDLLTMSFVPYGRTARERSFYADDDASRDGTELETHDRVMRAHAGGLLPAVNALRSTALHLGPMTVDAAVARRETAPVLGAYSALVMPSPADWPAHRRVTGYWRMPPSGGFSPDPSLRAFLDAGAAPVYVGFGSMIYEPSRLLAWVARMAESRGWRFLVSRGWVGQELPAAGGPHLHVIDDVPHDWLLPRVAAAVHHGGAGTTAASLTAGVPTVIAWFIVDQVLWARRVEALGVGVDLGRHADLDPERLEAGIERALSDAAMRARAVALGAMLSRERGCRSAAEAIEERAAWTDRR